MSFFYIIFCYCRKVTFTQALEYAIGPSSTNMTQELYANRVSPTHINIFSCLYSRDIPYGDCFNTEYLLEVPPETSISSAVPVIVKSAERGYR